jgi:TATA-binding protein-associated factor Taf7
MLIFAKRMIDGKGKTWTPGQNVPEGFSTPAGLAEMIKAGDIAEKKESKIDDGAGVNVPALLTFEQAVEFLTSEGVSLEDFGADEDSFEPVSLKDLQEAVAKFKEAKGESKQEKTPEEKAAQAEKMRAYRAAKKEGK